MILVRCVSVNKMYEIISFVFKQKTAYEMRISDWSSDVCSSDLAWDSPTKTPITLSPSYEVITPPSFRTIVAARSEEHTSELQSLMRISYAVFCLKKKKKSKSYI